MDTPSLQPDEVHPDWNEHVRSLRRLAASLLQGDDECDDAVQDALLEALTRPPRVLSWSWLAAVLRHRAVDRSRRIERRARHELRAESPTSAPSSDEIALRLELHGELNEAVRKLREPYRRVVYLRYFEDQTPSEIAVTLDLPVKTVKAQLARGLALLRDELRRRHGDDLRGLAILVPAWKLPVTASSGIGVALMLKKLVVVLLALVGLFGLWRVTRSAHAERDASALAVSASHVDATADTKPSTTIDDRATSERVAARTESEAKSAAPKPATVRVHVTWSDGTPASGVGMRVYDYGSTRPCRGTSYMESDAEGIARFENLGGEDIRARADRGSETRTIQATELTPGTTLDVDLHIAAGVAVHGKVRDGSGAAVASADIVIATRRLDWLSMERVGRSDANGSFMLRDVPASLSICAMSRGLSPTALVDLDLQSGKPPFEIELVFELPGGDLVGRVVDTSGAPIPHATVCINAVEDSLAARRRGGSAFRGDGTFEEPMGPRSVVCDSTGTFRIDGLPPGTWPIHVCAGGYPVWRSVVRIDASNTQERIIELDPGAQVVGTVRDETGKPVVGSIVRGFPNAVPETFINLGQFDDSSPFDEARAQTNAQGEYRLAPIWSGETHVYASPRRDEQARTSSELRAQETLHPKPGETLTWNAVLAPGHAIRGHARYADGSPLAEMFVNATPNDETRRLVTRTDKDGAFAFYNLAIEAYRIDIEVWESPPDAERVAREDVWPDQGDLVLTAKYDNPSAGAKCVVRGSVMEADGTPATKVNVRLSSKLGISYYATEFKDGKFRFDDAKQGEYRIHLCRGEDVVYTTEPFPLLAGEAHDVGLIHVPPKARLTLHIDLQGLQGAPERDASNATAPMLYVERVDAAAGRVIDPGRRETIKLDELSNGQYRVSWWGSGLAQGTITVDLDREAEVHIAPLPGFMRNFDVSFPTERAGDTLVMTVEGSDHTQYRAYFPRDWNKTSPAHTELMLPAGSFVIRASTNTGLKATQSLVVRADEAHASATLVDLH